MTPIYHRYYVLNKRPVKQRSQNVRTQLWDSIHWPEIAAVLGDQPSDGVEPRWVGQSLIPRSEGRASKTPPPAWF